MDSRGIGLSSKFSSAPTPAAGSTVQASTTGSQTRSKLGSLDWKLKFVIVMLIVAFVYATASRIIKTKKGGKNEKTEIKKGKGKAEGDKEKE